MKLDLKTNTKISYISSYIKEKFPMYHRSMNELDFSKLVNQINMDSGIKASSFEIVKNGDMDLVIDSYVDLYARNNLNDIWKNFGKLREYIIDVIKRNNKYKDSDNFILEMSMDVSLNISDQVGFDVVFANQYDTEILNCYLVMRNTFKGKLVKYIDNVFKSLDVKIGYDKSTTIAVFNMISDRILENYSEDNNYDENYIRDMYVEISKDINKRIVLRVRSILNNVDILSDIPEREIFSIILNMATVRGEISAIKIINGEMDEFIINVIKSKKKKTVNYDNKQVFQYVYNLLLKERDEEITLTSLSEFTLSVIDKLKVSEYDFTNEDIMEHRCDNIIRDMYLERYCPTADIIREKMKRQSLKTNKGKKKKPVDLLKRATLKRRIQRDLSCLLIVATLSSVGGITVGNMVNKRNEKDAISFAKSLDSTSYTISHTGDILEDISYENAELGIINYYNQLKQYGDEYVNLCFYNAFSDGLSLKDMDRLFNNVRAIVNKDENYVELSNVLNTEDCFLDFIYDNLIMMGCEEIKDDKYMDSLISYKQSFYGNKYGIVSDNHIYPNDQKNIDKMIKMYDEYCKKNLAKLGNKLQDNNSYNDSVSYNGSGRGI